jgi:hypothetical protein
MSPALRRACVYRSDRRMHAEGAVLVTCTGVSESCGSELERM